LQKALPLRESDPARALSLSIEYTIILLKLAPQRLFAICNMRCRGVAQHTGGDEKSPQVFRLQVRYAQ
jgi:hypothetical protein